MHGGKKQSQEAGGTSKSLPMPLCSTRSMAINQAWSPRSPPGTALEICVFDRILGLKGPLPDAFVFGAWFSFLRLLENMVHGAVSAFLQAAGCVELEQHQVWIPTPSLRRDSVQLWYL